MQYTRHIALLLFLLWSPFWLHCQKVKFDFFTTSNGLAGNNTKSITQDDRGFIWFLNDNKIHRYDGRNFVIYPSPPLGKSEFVESINWMTSYQDSLLLIFSDYTAFILNPKTEKWQTLKPTANTPITFRFTYMQSVAPNKVLLRSLEGPEERPVLWSFSNDKFERLSISPKNTPERALYSFSIDTLNQVYLANRQNLKKLNPSGQTITEVNLEACEDCWVNYMQAGRDHKIFVLQQGKVFTWDGKAKIITPHPLNRFITKSNIEHTAFIEEKNGNLWLSGQDKNLFYYDVAKDTLFGYRPFITELLPNACDLNSLFKDNTGTVWIGTQLGLLKVSPQNSFFDTYADQQQDYCNGYCSFRGFAEDQNGMVYASFYNGVLKFDPQRKESFPPFLFTNTLNSPFDLHIEDDILWLNSGSQLDYEAKKIRTISGSFLTGPDFGIFRKDTAGKLWWAYLNTLNYLEKDGDNYRWKEVINFPLVSTYSGMESLFAHPITKDIWLSQKENLYSYSTITNKLSQYLPETLGLPITRIMSIEGAPNGDLWLGTDIGLIGFNPKDGSVTSFSEQDGLPNNYICSILTEGDSCLWLGTNNGLSRFHIRDKIFTNFFEQDGLTYNEFNRMSYFKARDGRMYFGGLRGINAFYPQELIKAYENTNESAQMVLSSFEHVDEKRDSLIKENVFSRHPEIHLYHWDRSFTFEYALTDYNKPEEIFYSYQMAPYETNWSAPSKYNFTRFSSLPSGQYTFRVKARDSRGLWHQDELAVKVVVHPPWWKTSWAYLLYVLFMAGLAYAIFRFMKKRWLLRNELKVEQEEANRLKELDAFKSKLYTNLTHEFRTPLTVISGMAGQIIAQSQGKVTEAAQLIESNGKKLLQLINQLLDLSKLENKSYRLHLQQGDIIPYLRYITESFQTFVNSKNLSLRFSSNLESLVMDYDPYQMQHLLTNLISNAVKFTPSGGAIEVSILKKEDWLNLEVRDNGAGIAAKDLPNIFDRFYQADSSITRKGEGTGIGLALTRELTKLMGGNISVSSTLGIGSNFLIQLPIHRKSEQQHLLPMAENKLEQASYIPAPSTTTENNKLPELLIIEDNADVVVYLKSCLESYYQLDIAFNGKIGIEKALENVPDVIISDVMMPEKDGYEVCDSLKNDERTSHIPIILLTAKADVSSKLTGLKRGADVYLSKPFNKEELLVRLQMLITRQQRLVAYYSKKLNNESLTTIPLAPSQADLQIENAFIQKVRKVVAENYSNEDFALPNLCQKIGMSRSQLFRKMKALINTSPSEFIRSYRLQAAKFLLENEDLTISEVAWKVGYKDLAHFSKSFQDKFGLTPSALNK